MRAVHRRLTDIAAVGPTRRVMAHVPRRRPETPAAEIPSKLSIGRQGEIDPQLPFRSEPRSAGAGGRLTFAARAKRRGAVPQSGRSRRKSDVWATDGRSVDEAVIPENSSNRRDQHISGVRAIAHCCAAAPRNRSFVNRAAKPGSESCLRPSLPFPSTQPLLQTRHSSRIVDCAHYTTSNSIPLTGRVPRNLPFAESTVGSGGGGYRWKGGH